MSGTANNETTVATMRAFQASEAYVLDPHTAVGVSCAQQVSAAWPRRTKHWPTRRREARGSAPQLFVPTSACAGQVDPTAERRPMICLSCAHPGKFGPSPSLGPHAATDRLCAHRRRCIWRFALPRLVRRVHAHGGRCVADWMRDDRGRASSTLHTPTGSRRAGGQRNEAHGARRDRW